MSSGSAKKLGLAAVLILAWVCLWLLRQGSAVEVTIPPGLSASETAALLKEKGVIPFELPFRVAAKLTGADRRLKPGSYHLRRGMGLGRVLRLLETGAAGVKVAIPEGFSTRQIAERLEAEGVCQSSDFMKYVQTHRLEGYLFATTYYFEPSSGGEKAAHRMHQEFKRRIVAEYEGANPRSANLNFHQMVTLASIVEREAVLSREKPLIAAVYYNRLRRRMRLEADPTVQYALGRWKQGLTSQDLLTPSPYNTYLHYGLPPGPICSPGLDSFRAVLHPAQTDAFYFVADNTGGHIFSATLEEHQKAKQSFKKGLRRIKERQRREEAAKKRNGQQ